MTVHGQAAAGWEEVADAFERNLAEGLDAGGAVTVYRDGTPVVDLWGGTSDTTTGRPWERDTVACVFSATKGVAAMCVHLLVQRGLLDLDEPVSTYWPAFAGGGKGNLKVRWLLTHQAGLPSLDPDFTLEELRAVEPVLRAIEAQQPRWEPGTRFTYHAITFGFLVGELVRQVSGRTLAQLIATELTEPLGLRMWLGLPEAMDVDLARLELAPGDGAMQAALLGGALPPEVLKVLTMGSALPPLLVTGDSGDFNDRGLLSLELGASNLVTDARSLARTYAATVSEVDGVRVLDDATASACAPIQTGDTPIFGLPPELASAPHTQDFGLGFIAGDLLGPTSFGHHGASGAYGFADVEARVGFGYVPNRMHQGENVRAAALIRAVRKCL